MRVFGFCPRNFQAEKNGSSIGTETGTGGGQRMNLKSYSPNCDVTTIWTSVQYGNMDISSPCFSERMVTHGTHAITIMRLGRCCSFQRSDEHQAMLSHVTNDQITRQKREKELNFSFHVILMLFSTSIGSNQQTLKKMGK